jgi:glucose-1-phosphate cytidylyltransferase
LKAVIFAGGMGTRLQEETYKIPKPLVEVGDKPLLWHIMKLYSFYGIKEFVILAGYKQHLIKEFFHNYYLHNCNVTFYLGDNRVSYDKSKIDEWKVTVVNTGLETLTGDRLSQVHKLLREDENFLLTYGDGLSDININKLISYHNSSRNILTLTSVQPEGKYGNLILNDSNQIIDYEEKPIGDNKWINGGYMICNTKIFDNLQEGDFANTLKYLSLKNELKAYPHKGYWKSVDTLSDLNTVKKEWESNNARWKVWND